MPALATPALAAGADTKARQALAATASAQERPDLRTGEVYHAGAADMPLTGPAGRRLP